MAGEETTNAAAGPETSVPIIGSPPAKRLELPGLRRPPSNLWPYDATTSWGPWSAFFTVVLVVILSLAVAMVGSAVLMHGRSPSEALRTGTPLILFLVAQLLMMAGAVVAAGAKGGSILGSLALKPPVGGFWAYAKALALVLMTVGIYTAFTSYVVRHNVCEDLGEMSALFRGRWWFLALVVIGVGAPLSEELLFRGFLQSALVPTRLGYWGASMVTTTFWTLLHAGYSIPGLVEVFLIGLVFAWLLRRTGSLRVTLACHAIYNTGIASLLIFAPDQVFAC